MTPFRDWEEGRPFEVLEGGKARFGVKLPPGWEKNEQQGKFIEVRFRAVMLDTMKIEEIAHNKKVSAVRTVRGRLARTHDNRLIVVNEVRNGVFAAYYVNLCQYETLTKPQFDLIPVEAGNRLEEVDIIWQKIQKLRAKEDILLKSLEIALSE